MMRKRRSFWSSVFWVGTAVFFPTSDINPRVPPDERAEGRFVSSRMIIDACKPFRWLEKFPVSNVMSAERKAEMTKKWWHILKKLEM